MEHTSEGNETAESSLEIPHLKRVDNEAALPQTHSRDPPEEPSSRASVDSEWPENFALIQSPEMLLECMAGGSFRYTGASQSQSEPLSTSPQSSTNPAPIVKEITVKNYRSASDLNKDGKQPIRPGLWQNFTRLGSRITEAKSKETISIGRRDDAGKASGLKLGDHSPAIVTENDQKNSKATVNAPKNMKQEISTNQIVRSAGPLRTKVLQASGFQQFFFKSSLKGKGVASMNQNTHDASGQTVTEQISARPNASPGCDSMPRSDTKVESTPFLHGNNSSVGTVNHNEVSLREWLTPKHERYNKTDRMCNFKKILDFVDTCHSQGIALQNLCPSYFIISPLNQIKYIGSFIRQGQIEETCSLVPLNFSLFDNQMKRKKYLEEEKGSEEGRVSNRQKLDAGNKFGSFNIQHPLRYLRNVGQVEETRDNSCIGRNTGSVNELTWHSTHSSLDTHSRRVCISINQQDKPELKKLEEWWYASPEESSDSRCPFSSNIFSLGVLLFELISCFESWELHCAAMSDLRHRILPPSVLSESPKEAGFCLWLLHPDPSARPKSRDILASDLINETPDLPSLKYSSALIEEEDADADLLLDFLFSLKEQKEKQAAELIAGLRFLNADIEGVNIRRPSKAGMVSNEKDFTQDLSGEINMHTCGKPAPNAKDIATLPKSSPHNEKLLCNIEQLENAYFSSRTTVELSGNNALIRADNDVLRFRDRCHQVRIGTPDDEATDRAGAFFEGLCKYACYRKFQLRGCLKNRDILNSTNVICSLGFDRDEEYLAAAGVSKKIKIFEYDDLLNDSVDIHYPLVEMSSRSKVSCISWNSYIKNYLASTDYEGVVQLWDASTSQGLTQFVEHQRRAWSVHFSQVDPTKLASGGDDCSVKLWSINEKNSIDTIRNVANICCVQFSPYSSHLLAFGSSDYRTYCYDIRNTRNPWCTLAGHGKAVSYVKFLDSTSLVSASTDNTLKLWDLNRTSTSGLSTNACRLSLSGHTNEKNFVGLSICNGYISCGSETNEVFAYYKSFPMPITSYKFGTVDPVTGQETEDDNGQFVSSVCWREKSNVVVAANSTGCIKVLQLA